MRPICCGCRWQLQPCCAMLQRIESPHSTSGGTIDRIVASSLTVRQSMAAASQMGIEKKPPKIAGFSVVSHLPVAAGTGQQALTPDLLEQQAYRVESATKNTRRTNRFQRHQRQCSDGLVIDHDLQCTDLGIF